MREDFAAWLRTLASMKIRPISPADAPAMVNLIRATLDGSNQEVYPTETLEDLIEFFSSDETLKHVGQRFCLVAEGTGQLVAAVAVDGTQVVTFIVHPQYLRQGLGRELVEALEKAATSRNLPKLHISVGTAMATFFEKMGYGRTGQMISLRGAQIGLEKSLNRP